MLHLQVAVPTAAQQELLPRLELALKAMVREAVGRDVRMMIQVQLAKGSDGSAA